MYQDISRYSKTIQAHPRHALSPGVCCNLGIQRGPHRVSLSTVARLQAKGWSDKLSETKAGTQPDTFRYNDILVADSEQHGPVMNNDK